MKSIFKLNVSRLLQRIMAYHKKRPGKAVGARTRIAKNYTVKKNSCFKFGIIYISEACVCVCVYNKNFFHIII